jgi:dihydropyrimidinase
VRTLIVNGIVVNADGSRQADVLVDGERIVAVEPGLGGGISEGRFAGASGAVEDNRRFGVGPPDRVLDASGKLVIPGAIDAHTHMELPVGDIVSKDTFESGTRAAAFGGTTTIIDFATQSRGRSLREALDTWHAKADGHCCVDYAFHMAMCDVNDASLAEMNALVAEGVSSFKLFTAYPNRMYSDDGAILRAMLRTADNGGLILMHAENGLAVDVLAERLVAAGKADPWYHALAHPSGLEGEATHRVIVLAGIAGVPVYIVHVSAGEAVEEISAARARGSEVCAETCPQYLFLGLDSLKRGGARGLSGGSDDGFEGAKFVCSPPLRTPDHQEALWRGLGGGDLQVVATDHCPFDYRGQKELGRGDFRKIPNGLPGVEERVDLLHDGGVVSGRISRERWVDLISAAPARLLGLWGQKGAVASGFDADLVVYDPDSRHTLSALTHRMNVDYSCYEGREVQGSCSVVMSRGEVVVQDGEWKGRPGHGRFLRRRPRGGHR